jgi:hypothetical protein
MPKIRIDVASVATLTTKISAQKQILTDAEAVFLKAANGIDMKTGASSGVEYELNALSKKIAQQKLMLEVFEQVAQATNDQFMQTDKKISDEAKETSYFLDRAVTASAIAALGLSIGSSFAQENVAAISDLFGIKSMRPSDNAMFSLLKDVGSGLGDIGDISDLAEVFGDNKFFEALGKYSGKFKDLEVDGLKVFKTISMISDADKLVNAWNSGNAEDILGLTEKYIGKITTGLTGLTGFAGTASVKLGWNFGENLIEGFDIMDNEPNVFIGVAKATWNATGGAIIESGAEIAWDLVDFGYGLFGGDLDETYRQLTGVGGLEGAYKGLEMIGNEIGEVMGDAIYSGAKYVGDTLASWGDSIADGIANGAKNLFNWNW